MSETLDLSVVVPAYNRAGLIARALDSVAAQTVLPREIVVVDDGSSDGTPDVVASWAESAPLPVNLIVSPENRGVGAARNIAMRAARGSLIALLDSDDEYLPGALAMLAAPLARHPDAVVSFGEAEVRFADGAPGFRHVARNLTPGNGATAVMGEDGLYRIDDPQGELLTTSYISPSAAVFRRQAAIDVGLMPEKRYGEDWLFFLRLTGKGEFLVRFEDCAIIHRQDDNLTGTAHDYPNACRTLASLIEVRNNEHVAIAARHAPRLDRAIAKQAAAVRYFASRQGWAEYWRMLGSPEARATGGRAQHLLADPKSALRALAGSLGS